MNITIELRAAPIPKPLNIIAVHSYFVVYLNDSREDWERWELWETKNAFHKFKNIEDQEGFLHIHKNLKEPLDEVGGGPSFLLNTWSGKEALSIKQSIDKLKETYRYRKYYLPWPGPNSNTYISSILEASKISYRLPRSAIGKDWRGFIQFRKNNETKTLQFQLLTFGFKYVKNYYWEIHFLGFTAGHESNKQSKNN